MDDGAGHGIGLGGNQGIDHVVRDWPAGGPVAMSSTRVMHRTRASSGASASDGAPVAAAGEGLLQGSQIIHDVNPETGAARGAHTQSKRVAEEGVAEVGRTRSARISLRHPA